MVVHRKNIVIKYFVAILCFENIFPFLLNNKKINKIQDLINLPLT